MNIQKAIDILELNIPFTLKELKKAYYKAALKYHPDKNKTNLKNIKFYEVLDAYKFLVEYLKIENSYEEIESEINHSVNYEYILKNFINSIQDICLLNTDISKLILEIINNYQNISVSMFDNIDKNSAKILLGYIEQYSTLFNINKKTINKIRSIIENKINDALDSLFILNPSIDNLLNKDIYKLEYANETYYIPLWHDEIIYELNNHSIIVKCIPHLPEHISIDDNNNINVSLKISFTNILDRENLTIDIGNKNYEINIDDLKIKRNQMIILKDKGIPIINMDNIYDTKKKSNIQLYIELIN